MYRGSVLSFALLFGLFSIVLSSVYSDNAAAFSQPIGNCTNNLNFYYPSDWKTKLESDSATFAHPFSSSSSYLVYRNSDNTFIRVLYSDSLIAVDSAGDYSIDGGANISEALISQYDESTSSTIAVTPFTDNTSGFTGTTYPYTGGESSSDIQCVYESQGITLSYTPQENPVPAPTVDPYADPSFPDNKFIKYTSILLAFGVGALIVWGFRYKGV